MKNNSRSAATAVQNNKNNAQSINSPVPHVVRVTFLGVAGISANPKINDENEGPESSSHLTFPLASNLRAVASISRTYKSGGRPSGLSNCLSKSPGGSDNNSLNSATIGKSSSSESAERFVAVWNDDCKDVNPNLVNTSNNVAFEAELVPSQGEKENDPSSAYAPKTFCVTLGLVPDVEEDEMVAIPIGFANLTINGEETLNGRRKQLDLPLTSVTNFIGPFGGESPLIKVTKSAGNGANAADDVETETKTKKSKSIAKRIFKKGAKPTNEGDIEARSIFELGRPPNKEERKLFLERFGVDQSGDAIVRVALEVFPRGSELEKTFRNKAKLRKRNQRKKAAAKDTTKVAPTTKPLTTRSSEEKRTSDKVAASSSSLLDDEEDDDEDDSDCDYSDYSQSCTQISSDGSWDEENTGSWGDEEETYATFEDTVDTMDTMESTDTREVSVSTRTKSKGVFGRMFDCAMPTCAKEDIFEMEDDYVGGKNVGDYNIDTVASAIESMSISSDHNSLSDESRKKRIPSPAKSIKPKISPKSKVSRESDVAEAPSSSPAASPKVQQSIEEVAQNSDEGEEVLHVDTPLQSRDTEESSQSVTHDDKYSNAGTSPTANVTRKKSRGGFKIFRRNQTKKDKMTATVEASPVAGEDTLLNEIRDLIDKEIQEHELTLAQQAQGGI